MASQIVVIANLIFLSFCIYVDADTPANCTYEEISGSWLFSIGEGGHDNTIYCSSFKPVSELHVTLLFPDVAVDSDGNVGFWTLIYNQGFEVNINGVVYFAFSSYEKSGEKVISFCDKTLNGWSHAAKGYHAGNWACYSGKKTSGKVPPKTEYFKPQQNAVNHEFIPNREFIDQINSAQSSWKAVVYEEYSGMTTAQLISRGGGLKRQNFPKPSKVKEADLLKAQVLPEEFDWRNVDGKNYVSPIRNQGSCGSCYAFGTMAMFEARVRIMSNGSVTPVFSTQDIVSCSEYSQGCEGGFPYLISKYAKDFGLVDEECFPYEGKEVQCKEKRCSRQFGTGYHYIGGFYGGCNEVLMRIELVKNGPVAVSFEVYNDFRYYKGGIYHHTGLTDKFNPFEITNHVVAIVGYGADKETGEKFWIVKNSWGESWGESGFFRIRRGTDECSIESIAVSAQPILE
ncbi:dipeptidyl peptidase 1-like [Pocillopora verrucosa]|uniref:dipeptidyl peptidase 1-like n=1 Tax=Pocillopora verrucosa TaxID=203993 RepID=UPI00333EC4A1